MPVQWIGSLKTGMTKNETFPIVNQTDQAFVRIQPPTSYPAR